MNLKGREYIKKAFYNSNEYNIFYVMQGSTRDVVSEHSDYKSAQEAMIEASSNDNSSYYFMLAFVDDDQPLVLLESI